MKNIPRKSRYLRPSRHLLSFITTIVIALLLPSALANENFAKPLSSTSNETRSTETNINVNVDANFVSSTKLSLRDLSSKSSNMYYTTSSDYSDIRQPPPNAVVSADRCTAIVVGKKGSLAGHTMTTHTSDCAECDWRINKGTFLYKFYGL